MEIRKRLVAASAGLLVLAAAPHTSAQQRPDAPGAQPRPSGKAPLLPVPMSPLTEFRPIGGRGNNLTTPAFDAVPGAAELALAPLHFAPGTADGLVAGPNPRTMSNLISGGTGAGGTDSQTTDPRATAWLYVFGQFVDHDLSLERSLPDGPSIDIPVPAGDPDFHGASIALQRDIRDPGTHTTTNTVAGYLDLSQVYGSTPEQAASLRGDDGLLASSHDGQALPIAGDAFVSGDARVMENPELTAVTTLFMREHNAWASAIRSRYPGWSADMVYDMARSIVTAEYQNIVYNEYLPVLVGAVGAWTGYNPAVNAQVSQEFAAAAFRVGHSQVSEVQAGIDNQGNEVFTQSLAQAFFNTAEQTFSNGIDPLLRNLSQEASQATDVYVVPTLRNLLFAPLAGGTVDQVDLIAIDIQRERDVGVNTLNATRQALGLRPYVSFADLTNDTALQGYFASVYGDIGSVDLFMGGLAEAHAPGASVGPTFQAIIGAQFQALRTGDRFYWENQGFPQALAQQISRTQLSDILLRNTDSTSVPARVFVLEQAPRPPRRADRSQPVNNHGRLGAPFMLP